MIHPTTHPTCPGAMTHPRRGTAVSARLRRTLGRGSREESGMTSAEYAVGTLAACAFAGVLYKVVSSDTVAGMLTDIVQRALQAVP